MERRGLPVNNYAAMRGFTLIELVMVIVILGILAGMAAPHFIDLSKDARISTVNAMAGTLRSTAVMAHAMQLTQGVDMNGTLTVSGSAIQLVNGYPSRGSVDDMMADTSGFTYDPVAGTFRATGSPTAECAAIYVEAPAWGQEPTISVTTTGC